MAACRRRLGARACERIRLSANSLLEVEEEIFSGEQNICYIFLSKNINF